MSTGLGMGSRDAAGTEAAHQEEETMKILNWCGRPAEGQRMSEEDDNSNGELVSMSTMPMERVNVFFLFQEYITATLRCAYVHCWILMYYGLILYSPK
jgi:hypothetical protein